MSQFVYDIYDGEVYRRLRNLLDSNDLILFAGAGLSAQATTDKGRHPPLWNGLINGVIDWCLRKDFINTGNARQLRKLVKAGFLIDAGQEIQEILEPLQLQQAIGEVVLCNQARTGLAHKLVAKTPFRAYITTNYDEFIEGEYRTRKGVSLPRYYEKTVRNVLEIYRQRKPFIFKMHGDINDPSTIILGTRNYEKLLYTSSDYRDCLHSIFAASSVLFLGFGANDPDLDSIITRVASFDGRSKRHWIVVPKGSFPILKAKRLWADKGIYVIEYKKDLGHTGLVKFLRRLNSPLAISKKSE